MNTGHSERKLSNDYNLATIKLQVSICESDFGVDITSSLSPENLIRRNYMEASCLLVNVLNEFKYVDKEKFRKIFRTYIRPKLRVCIISLVT